MWPAVRYLELGWGVAWTFTAFPAAAMSQLGSGFMRQIVIFYLINRASALD
jgi:hypothetical protein